MVMVPTAMAMNVLLSILLVLCIATTSTRGAGKNGIMQWGFDLGDPPECSAARSPTHTPCALPHRKGFGEGAKFELLELVGGYVSSDGVGADGASTVHVQKGWCNKILSQRIYSNNVVTYVCYYTARGLVELCES